jgi:hypothetical protein
LASGNLDHQQQEETGLPVPPVINDLYGALSVGVNNEDPVADLDDPLPSSSSFQPLTGGGASSSVTPPPAAGGSTGFINPRAVITAMPFLPNSPTAAVAAVMSAAAAAGGVPPPGRHHAGDEDGDTHSVDTMPMPHKRRRLTTEGGEEASSRPSPNDRAYQPTTTSSSVGASHHGHHQQQQQGGGGGGNGGASSAAPTSGTNNAAQQQQAAVNHPPPAGLTTTPSGTLKAVLVAKVLTKSDSSSKRIILPRIAVEANLPQVTQGGGHGKTFYFSAEDPSGASWPLCIKAWANGQNPKPVYVLEQVGDLMKQQKLGVGDAVAVLASQSGDFYIEWNTEQAKVAAARPTLSTFTFAAAGAPAAAATAAAPKGQSQQQPQAAVVPPPAVKQEQQAEVTQQGLVITTSAPLPSPRATPPPVGAAASAAAAAGGGRPSPAVPSVQPQEQHQQQQQQSWVSPFQAHASAAAAAAAASEQQVKEEPSWDSPLPQELLSCERVLLPLEHPFDRVFDRPATSRSMFLTIDDSQPSLADGMGGVLPAGVPAAAAAAGGGGDHDHDAAAALEALMAAEGVVTEEGGAMHQGGYLVCPRTPGCTRPAGHQGWCVGHKGFKKRARGSPPGPY